MWRVSSGEGWLSGRCPGPSQGQGAAAGMTLDDALSGEQEAQGQEAAGG